MFCADNVVSLVTADVFITSLFQYSISVVLVDFGKHFTAESAFAAMFVIVRINRVK